jgi:hypothetical protein
MLTIIVREIAPEQRWILHGRLTSYFVAEMLSNWYATTSPCSSRGTYGIEHTTQLILGKAIEVYENTAVIPPSGGLHLLIDQLQNIGARNRTSWLRLLRDRV